MKCARCRGLMVVDRLLDMGQADILWAFVWRCINCGEVLDAVIQHHRRCRSHLSLTHKPALRAKISSLQRKERGALPTSQFPAGTVKARVH
jgi:hypothetical protein